ncbi:MAG: HAD-IA family hydrolase [Deltaproteobacteria bacterium]|nr:HAD-IA family hydrolase [Deltaproteobacteria bacterium]
MTHQKNTLSAVIFDMDGVIFDSERLSRDIWRQTAAESGFELSDEIYGRLIGRSADDTKECLRRIYGPRFPLDACIARAHSLFHRRVAEGCLAVKEGLWEILDFLEALPLPKAVATSTSSPTALFMLRRTGLDSRFDAIVTGDLVPRGKPAPDIFLEAARRLGAAPRTCIVLEDSPAGLRGAAAAGMKPFFLLDLVPLAPADQHLPAVSALSLNEAREHIQNLIENSGAAIPFHVIAEEGEESPVQCNRS